MWHFLDLTTEQKQQRRELLDHYAWLSQVSALIPILLIGVVRLFRYLVSPPARPPWASPSCSPPSSPYLKATHSQFYILILRQAFNRTSFWLSAPPSWSSVISGTNGQIIATCAWTIWLLVLTVVDTRDDYLHLTKRVGLVGAAQLPLHYLLATKSPHNPVAVATGLPWERLNTYHQLLGRVISGLFWAHAALYLNYFVQINVLTRRIWNRDVLLGLVAVATFSSVGASSLAWVRRRAYWLFVALHVGLSVAILPILWWHVHHIRIYVAQTAVILAGGAALRWYATVEVQATLRVDAVGGLLELSIPRAQWSRSFAVGQHVYLSSSSWTSRIPIATGRNPFTISSLPTDPTLRLIIKQENGATRQLHELIRLDKNITTPGCGAQLRVRLEGPYGLSRHFERLVRCSDVLLIAGGVGATFTVALFRALMGVQHTQMYDSGQTALVEGDNSMYGGSAPATDAQRRPIETVTPDRSTSTGYGAHGRLRSRSRSHSSPQRRHSGTSPVPSPWRTRRPRLQGTNLLSPDSSRAGDVRRGHTQQSVTLLWVVRTENDLAWALDELIEASSWGRGKVILYITRPDGDLTPGRESQAPGRPMSARRTRSGATEEVDDGVAIEMRSLLARVPPLDSDEFEPQHSSEDHMTDGHSGPLPGRSRLVSLDPNVFETNFGQRPRLSEMVDEVVTTASGGRTGVYVCGPAAVGECVRIAVAGHVSVGGKEVTFWDETFGLS